MKLSLRAVVALVFFLGISFSRGEDWTVNGKTYHNVTVTKVDADVVHVMYDGGIGSINLSDLPPDLQKKFNYDPDKAAAAAQQKAAARAAAVADLKAHSKPLPENNSTGSTDTTTPSTDDATPTADATTPSYDASPTPQANTLAGLDTSSKIYQMLNGTGAVYTYDKFKETSEIQSKEFDLGNGVTITFYARSDTKDLYKPDSYYALVYSSSTEWRFLTDSDIDIKADKVLIERKDAANPKYAETHDGGVSEMLDLDLSEGELKQISNCSVLYFRIATTEFNLAQVQQGIKLFYDATQT